MSDVPPFEGFENCVNDPRPIDEEEDACCSTGDTVRTVAGFPGAVDDANALYGSGLNTPVGRAPLKGDTEEESSAGERVTEPPDEERTVLLTPEAEDEVDSPRCWMG
jgi:hypothetical protein